MDVLSSFNGDYRVFWLAVFCILVFVCVKLFKQSQDIPDDDEQEGHSKHDD